MTATIKKITEFPAYTTPQATDVLVIVDVANDETKKIALADLPSSGPDIPTNVSYFSNDAGYLTSESDPDFNYWSYKSTVEMNSSAWDSAASDISNNAGNWSSAYNWGDHSQVGYLQYVDFHDLGDFPTDAVGFLKNDGNGGLSWTEPGLGVEVLEHDSYNGSSAVTLCTFTPSSTGFYEVGGSILVVAVNGAYSVALVVDYYDAVGSPHTMSIPLIDISGTIHSSPVTTGDGYPLSAIVSSLYAVSAGDITLRVVTTGTIYNYHAAGWIKRIA